MKKFITALTALSLAGLVLAGCGGKADSETETAKETESGSVAETAAETESVVEFGPEAYVDGINAADYVTLGEYNGMDITIEALVVTEGDIDDYIENVWNNKTNWPKIDITDRGIENGDTANIDYVGKIDGVAFDNGSDTGYDLEIGSGSFIEGFEEGLLGAKTGDTLDVNVTFPENYENGSEVAGKPAVFTVKVNQVYTRTQPELDDAFVKSLNVEGCTNMEEYRTYVRGILQEEVDASAEEAREQRTQSAILEGLLEVCTFQEPPADMIERYKAQMKSNIQYQLSMMGFTGEIDSYLDAVGLTEEQFLRSATDQSHAMIAMKAIADKENLNPSEEEMNAQLETEAADYNYTLEEYKAAVDMSAFKEYMMSQKVLEFLSGNAKVTEVEPEPETEAAQETESESQSAETETANTEAGSQEKETGTASAAESDAE